MRVRTITGKETTLPKSPIFQVFPGVVSDRVVEEIQTLNTFSEETLTFVFVTQLDYLLYNHRVKYMTDIPQLKEIKEIRSEVFPEVKLHRLLKRFRGYEQFLNFEEEVDIQLALSLNLVNVLSWVYRKHKLGPVAPLVDKASWYGHLEALNWFATLPEFDFTVAAVDGASENGHLEVLKWFFSLRGHNFKFKDAIALASLRGHTYVVKWFQDNFSF